MEQITFTELEKFNRTYNDNPNNKIVENAIKHIGIDKFCLDQNVINKTYNVFNIELPKSKIYDQVESERCWIHAGVNLIKNNVAQNLSVEESEYALSRNSKLLMIRKPFFALSVVNLLNGMIGENEFKEAQAAGRKPFSCESVHVLAVDDEEMNLVVAKGVLGSYEMEVDICQSGREAIERCSRIPYEVVFLDHMMPGFDGVETLKQLREINNGMYQDLPVVALTANPISGAREMFRNEGFSEFIPKPIERAVLERVLRRVLPKHFVQYGDREEAVEILLKDSAQTAPAQANLEILDQSLEGTEPAEPEASVEEAAGASAIPYDRLTQAGINVELGLNYCGGDESFFRDMLQMFHAQSEGKKAEIIALYEDANWTDYAIKVHALKSTSLTIGAEALSAQAKELELAGKRGDVDFILANHAALMRAYDTICVQITGI